MYRCNIHVHKKHLKISRQLPGGISQFPRSSCLGVEHLELGYRIEIMEQGGKWWEKMTQVLGKSWGIIGKNIGHCWKKIGKTIIGKLYGQILDKSWDHQEKPLKIQGGLVRWEDHLSILDLPQRTMFDCRRLRAYLFRVGIMIRGNPKTKPDSKSKYMMTIIIYLHEQINVSIERFLKEH